VSAAFTVLVVTHDSASELPSLFSSLAQHLVPPPPVVLVDAGSSDASIHVGREAGAEVLEARDNPGFGAANNLGMQRVRTPVTALLNPDVELVDNGLAALAERAEREAALVVPRLIGPGGRVEKSVHPVPGRLEAFAFALLGPALPPPLRLRAEPWRSRRPRPVGWAVAAALVARTDILRDLGPFVPASFLFYEDLDLCLRARSRGFPTVLVPSVTVRHRGGHSTTPAFAGEPFELLAARRREVVGARLGRRAQRLDDAAQAVTFGSRLLAKRLSGRRPERERRQLSALRTAQRDGPDAC
jgi:N-acetylglucosaminyl-diphospho-decaprenol L-rhamnosyltransferase